MRIALRGLRDPVRTLSEAIADITAGLEGEFDAGYTTRLRRAEIIQRLALVRSVLTKHSDPVLAPSVRAAFSIEGQANDIRP